MSTISGNLVVGIFDDHDNAEQALGALRQAGFLDTEVGVIAPQAVTQSHTMADSSEAAEKKIVEDASAGALLGAGLGGLGALALATLMVPPVGPIVIGGFLTMLAVGGTGGALAGGIVGALVGMGLPEQHAREIEQALLVGCTVLKVRTEARQVEAADILDRHGAQHVDTPPVEALAATAGEHHAHLDMRPEHLLQRDTPLSAGGFTTTGGFGGLAQARDGENHFHLPGVKTAGTE